MAITNLMEQVVKNTVKEVLKKEKDPGVKKIKSDDIVAYVLNRVQPKYITSERGLLHGKLDAKFKIQEKTDILLMVYEAINEILNGRESAIAKDSASSNDELHFPHVIGEVLEETTFSIIPDIEVSLNHDGSLVEMYDENWKNPYKTNCATKGYFHFWPQYSARDMGKGSKVAFTLSFTHPDFQEKSIDIDLKLLKPSDIGKSHTIPIVLIQLKDGIEPDYLK